MQTPGDAQAPQATAHADRLKGVFAYAGSPEAIGHAARAAAAEAHRVPRSENVSYGVALSRYAFTDGSESWRQSHPHWGVVVDDTFYHVTINVDVSKPCRLRWQGADHDGAFDASINVGTTTVPHRQIVLAMMHIAEHFGAPFLFFFFSSPPPIGRPRACGGSLTLPPLPVQVRRTQCIGTPWTFCALS